MVSLEVIIIGRENQVVNSFVTTELNQINSRVKQRQNSQRSDNDLPHFGIKHFEINNTMISFT
jgi:hypothetical protein